ncbi:MAG: efflux RND transporter periplasmic adaptor subunit [Dokdonella sp.]|nr:MAG: efflux RND transporter periplasmic adaptor subunit [Dokdonella sp.]
MAVRSGKPLLLLVALLSLAACGGRQQSTALPALPALATFTVAAPQELPGQRWDGVVEAVQRADLSAQTSGRVTAVEVDVNDRVAADAVLLRISAVEQDALANTARAQLRAAEAAAVEAEQAFQRHAALAQSHYVSRAQLDQARAARDSAVAARGAAQAQLAQALQQTRYTVVRAPFAGIVARRDVEPGETVAPGQPLLGLYAPDALRIEVALPQTRAEAVRQDPRASVSLPDGRVVTPAQVIVFPAADVASHSVNVRVVLPALMPPPAPGTTAKVVFTAAAQDEKATLAAPVRIPVGAVAQRGELSGAYVREGGHLLLRQLRLGAREGDVVDVISGLAPGDVVVADPVAAAQALAAQRRAMGARHD